jgi:hypothetical protein
MRFPSICGAEVLVLILASASMVLAQSPDKRVRVKIEITDEGSGPIPRAKAEIISVATAESTVVTTNDLGAAQIDLAMGDYDAIVSCNSFRTLHRRMNVSASDGQTVMFTLRVASFSGPTVPDPDPTKFVDVRIVVADPSEARIPGVQIRLSESTASANAKTNEGGELSVKVVPGTQFLFASVPLFQPVARTIQIKAGSDQTVSVTLPLVELTTIVQGAGPHPPMDMNQAHRPTPLASSTLIITVTNLEGIPIPYAQVGGVPLEAIWKFPEADEEGRIKLKLIRGEYDVVVTSPMYDRWTKQIYLRDEENREIRALLAKETVLKEP